MKATDADRDELEKLFTEIPREELEKLFKQGLKLQLETVLRKNPHFRGATYVAEFAALFPEAG